MIGQALLDAAELRRVLANPSRSGGFSAPRLLPLTTSKGTRSGELGALKCSFAFTPAPAGGSKKAAELAQVGGLACRAVPFAPNCA